MGIQDFRIGLRKIVRDPGEHSVSFITLAVGIGVSAAIFAVVWSARIRPLPVSDQDRIAVIWSADHKGGMQRLELSFNEIAAIEKESKSVESVAAFGAANFPAILKRGGVPMQFAANIAGGRYFETLGIRPFLGRAFSGEEMKYGGPEAVLLTYRCWRERFGGDRRVIGEKLISDTGVVTIAGVLVEHIELPPGAEVLYPLAPMVGTDAAGHSNRVLAGLVKLRPGVTRDAFERELSVIEEHVRASESRPDAIVVSLYAVPFVDELLGRTKYALDLIATMGVLILAISLFNTSSVALARGIDRTGEIGVRKALGATRASIMARLFAEACAVTLPAGFIGFVLARLLVTTMVRFAPAATPRIEEIRIGWESVVFASIVAVLAALVTAAAQVLRPSNAELQVALRSSKKSTSHRGAKRLLEVIAWFQTMFAVVTLAIAGLLVATYREFAAIDVGFATQNVTTMRLGRELLLGPDSAKARQFYRIVVDRVRQLPGVVAAGAVLMRPLEIEQGWDLDFTVEGQGVVDYRDNPLANYLACTPRYFDAMGMRLLAGRDFTEDDRPGSGGVAVVGASFSRRYFGSPAAAIGKRFKRGAPDSKRPWLTIVGVVNDVRSRDLTTEKLDIYTSYNQFPWSPNFLAVRTSTEVAGVVQSVRQVIAGIDKDVPVGEVRTTRQLVDAKLMQPKLNALLVAMFAVTATLLALVGFYGVVAYNARQRIPEIGVRIAVGADSPSIVRLLVKRALFISLLGCVAGLLLTAAMRQRWPALQAASLRHSIPAMIVVLIVFLILAALASLVPALRAANTDSVSALRSE